MMLIVSGLLAVVYSTHKVCYTCDVVKLCSNCKLPIDSGKGG